MRNYSQQAYEVSLRIRKKTGVLKEQIKRSEDAAAFMRKIFDEDTIEYNESFFVVFLNAVNKTTAWIKISSGGLTGTVIDTRMVIKAALDSGAISIILSHNHPSGSLKPSNADIKLTKQITDAAKLFNISVLDHIILTADRYYSFGDDEKL